MIIFLLLSLAACSHTKVVYNNYGNYVGSFKTLISIGTPEQIVPLEMNMEETFNWVSNFNYNKEKSRSYITFGDSTATIDGQNVKSSRMKDIFLLSDTKTDIDYNYFHLISSSVKGNGFIGLGYAPRLEEGLLTHQMFQKGIISKKSFGFRDNKIFFGGFLEDEKLRLLTKKSCDLLPNHKTWGCALTSIQVKEHVKYDNQYYSYFQSKNEELSVPEDFLSLYEEAVFDSFYKEKVCMRTKLGSKDSIVCQCDKIQGRFPKLILNFKGGIRLQVEFNELFYKYYNSCILLIEKNTKKEFMIGAFIFKKYPMLFDYDEGRITVYEPEENYEGDDCRGIIMLVHISVNLFGIIYLIFSKKLFNVYIFLP